MAKMKLILIVCISSILIIGCSFGGFKPPPRYLKWQAPNYPHITDSDPDKAFYKWVVYTNNEMRACGMDPFDGESHRAEVNLCLEKKGWYLKEGPYCENELAWNKPLCIEWRKKHSKPDAKPWAPIKD